MNRRRIILTLVIIILSSPFYAQEMEVPLDTQFSLFTRILSFDRNLKDRVGEEIVLGIVYQKKFRPSLNVKNVLQEEINRSPEQQIEGIALRSVALELGNLEDFRTALVEQKIDAIYIAPLRAVSLKGILAVSRPRQIISLTGVPQYCDLGVSVGIELKGGSPAIIINRASSLSEGVDFSSGLLNLARVIE